jgi:6-phosphofructokinase
MVGTDMTIGADSALHRITEAIDAMAAPPPATSAPSSSR